MVLTCIIVPIVDVKPHLTEPSELTDTTADWNIIVEGIKQIKRMTTKERMDFSVTEIK